MSALESTLQRRIREALEAHFPTSWWTKYHGGPYTRAGVPDLLGSVKGRFLAFEVKRDGQDASLVQRRQIALLARAGAITGVVRTVAEALKLAMEGLAAELGDSPQFARCDCCGNMTKVKP